MIINNGPIGRKFNPLKDILVKFDGDNNFKYLSFSNNYSVNTPTDIEYILNCQDMEGTNFKKWYLKFFKNCQIQIIKKLKCEIFMVGKGNDGEYGDYANGQMGIHYGGDGGDGGKIKVYNNEILDKNSIYNIIIEDNNVNMQKQGTETYYTSSEGLIHGIGGEKGYANGNRSDYEDLKNGEPGTEGILKYGIYYGNGGGGSGGFSWASSSSDGYSGYYSISSGGAHGGGYNEEITQYLGGAGGGACGDGKEGYRNTGSGGGAGGGGNSTVNNFRGKPGQGSYGTIIISNY